MTYSTKTLLAAVALSTFVAGPVAANVSGQSINGAVQSAVSEGNVNVFVDDGVATLFGWADNQMTADAAKHAALDFDNVESVVDLITLSN